MSRKPLFYVNWGLLTPIVILVVLSLITLFSINIDYFKTQFIYLIISIIAFLFFSQVNCKVIKFYSLPIYFISLLSLVFILILGSQSRGAVRWLDIWGFRIQFSEIIKPFLLISLSYFLSKRSATVKTFLLSFCFLMPIALLIYKQPDLGNTIIFLLTTILTFIICGFSLLWLIGGFFVILGTSPVVWHFMHEYQKQRIVSFIYPLTDPLGVSYNAIQSMITVGSGLLFGKGFSQGTQSYLRFLPEQQTDFIFATISENLGFIGSLTIILCFTFFLYQLYLILKRNDDGFCRIFIASSFSLILIQVFLNIGMNIGLLPIVGVTLPFVSSGGSSLLSSFILLGFITSVDKESRDKDTLEIK